MVEPQLNYEQLQLEADRVADLYHQLTLDLFDEVIRRLKERGAASLQDNPYIWQLEKMNNMRLLNDHNIKLIAERSEIAEEQLRQVIEGEGYRIYQNTYQQLAEDLGKPGRGENRAVQERLIALANQTFREVDNLINTNLPASIRTGYQSAVTKTVAEVVAGTKTAEQALNDTLMQWAKDGFIGFRDKAGRQWKVDNYARTIIKSTTRRAYNEARMAPAKELGIDTFYYSVKSSAREMCAPLQHQIVTTGQGRIEEGVRVLALSDYGWGTPGGCLGVNCGHDLTPFIPGANLLPELPEHLKNLTPEQAIQNANAEAKQRALERNIRRNKELLHVARQLGDKELVQKYRLRGATLNDAMKDWLDKYPHLKRNKAREKYYDDPYTMAKTEIKVRKELEKLEKYRAEQKEMREKFNAAVKSGIIKTEINNEHFENHVRGTKGYDKYLQKNLEKGAPPPSYLTITKEECQALVDKYAGTGQFKYNPKSNKMQEIISQNKPIGTYIDPRTGEVIENATDFRIHYSKTGSHIVPTIKGKGGRK